MILSAKKKKVLFVKINIYLTAIYTSMYKNFAIKLVQTDNLLNNK